MCQNNTCLSECLCEPSETATQYQPYGKPVWLRAGTVVGALDQSHQPIDIGNSTTLTGVGQVVAVYDTGLDSGDINNLRNFDKSKVTLLSLGNDTKNNDFNDSNKAGEGHGTHVAGIIAMNDTKYDMFYGLARNVTLVIQLQLQHEFGQALKNSLTAKVKIHNNSWANDYKADLFDDDIYSGSGKERSPYDIDACISDYFSAKNRDFLIVAGASNAVKSQSVGSPGTSKNAITVGSCQNNVLKINDAPHYKKKTNNDITTLPPLYPDIISWFSSRGPTDDGRIKPDVIAPGECILSTFSQTCSSSGDRGTETQGTSDTSDEFQYQNGTSMATPVVSSCAALLREWLTQHIKNKISNPSSALLKALLIHSAERVNSCQWASFEQGWGRVNLHNIFKPKANLYYFEEKDCLATSDIAILKIKLKKDTIAKITLVWIDPVNSYWVDTLSKHKIISSPDDLFQLSEDNKDFIRELMRGKVYGKIGIEMKKPKLVNNLDLKIVGPKHIYLGNCFDSSRTYSEPLTKDDSLKRDSLNNVECIVLDPNLDNNFVDGDYEIAIKAENIQKDSLPFGQMAIMNAPKQSFVLVVSGNIQSIDTTFAIL